VKESDGPHHEQAAEDEGRVQKRQSACSFPNVIGDTWEENNNASQHCHDRKHQKNTSETRILLEERKGQRDCFWLLVALLITESGHHHSSEREGTEGIKGKAPERTESIKQNTSDQKSNHSGDGNGPEDLAVVLRDLAVGSKDERHNIFTWTL
jgi:hypothetical protein